MSDDEDDYQGIAGAAGLDESDLEMRRMVAMRLMEACMEKCMEPDRPKYVNQRKSVQLTPKEQDCCKNCAVKYFKVHRVISDVFRAMHGEGS